MAFVLQSFAEDTLASDIADSSTSMTLTTGNFGTPSGEQMLVIDPDVSTKREIIKCAIDGTAVTSIDRAQDGTAAVAHTSGAKIIMAWTKSHHEALKDGSDLNDNIITAAKLDANLLAGWLLLAASGTRVGNTSFTVSGDVTDQIAVGDKLKITDTTTKYLYVTAVTYGAPNTTITVTGGTDYVVAGNPTNIYYSKATSPVGFPTYFNFNPSRAVSGGTAPTYTYHDQNIFWMNGRTVHGQIIWRNLSGGTAGNGANPLTFTPPVTMSSTNYNNSFAVFGNGNCYEVGGTIVGVSVKYVSSSTMGFASNASGIADITGNDQSSVGRHLNANFAYVV